MIQVLIITSATTGKVESYNTTIKNINTHGARLPQLHFPINRE